MTMKHTLLTLFTALLLVPLAAPRGRAAEPVRELDANAQFWGDNERSI
jgi:hypothetical protein